MRSKSLKLDHGRRHSLFLFAKYILYVIALAIGLESAGVDVTILIASSAALLVGLGLGLQQFFNDYVSGFFLLLEGTIQKGDILELDGMVGKVVEINLRNSKMSTRDDIIVIVPNHKFMADSVINWSHNKKIVRFNVEVGVSYGADVILVQKILEETAAAHPDIIQHIPEKKPFARFIDFGESSLDFNIFFFSDAPFRIENVKSDLRFSITQEFRKNGVEIPFPQRDLHIKTGTLPIKHLHHDNRNQTT